jgi:polyferredoxin
LCEVPEGLPVRAPVDKLVQIRSVECTACLECVAVCPAKDALAMSSPKLIATRPKKAALPPWAMAAGIAVLSLGATGFVKATGHWKSPIPTTVYEQLVPKADQATRPMPGR